MKRDVLISYRLRLEYPPEWERLATRYYAEATDGQSAGEAVRHIWASRPGAYVTDIHLVIEGKRDRVLARIDREQAFGVERMVLSAGAAS